MKNHVFSCSKTATFFSPLNNATRHRISESKPLPSYITDFNFRYRILWVSIVAGSLACGSGTTHAALVSACTGVSLPKSVVTDIVGTAVSPLAQTLDTVLFPITGLLGLNSNLTTTLNTIAAGDPVTLNALDTSGNIVSPSDACQTTADGYQLNTPKGISFGGNQITGLGGGTIADAGEINSIAIGNAAATDAAALNSIAIGTNATIGANGTNSVVIGSGASANVANSVVLGAGSTATTGAQTNYSAYGLSAPQTSVGEVSVGSSGNERKITNLAAGSAGTDAVNVNQLQALSDRAVKYDSLILDKSLITLEGPVTTDGGTTNGTRITNLAKGDVSANSSDAVNGSQLYNITQGFTTNIDNLGNSTATNLGGGAAYNPTTGIISAPSYNVYGTTQSNVGDAITVLQTNAPLQYSDTNGVATPQVPSNDVTLVGSVAGPVRIHNVADGIAPNDAVNKSQLDAVQGSVSSLDALAVKYDSSAKDAITLAGPVSNDGGATGGTIITNLHQGALSASSTDAVNGAQLYATNQMVLNMQNGGGMKYFHVNSTAADSSSTGMDSIAAGPRALSSGVGSVAIGDNSQATQDGAIAIGQSAASTGLNAIAIGTGAVATGSVAVGAGAQAGNGGAAFGDNAVALAPQQGTALGNAATVTSDRGVALGAGAQATRAGMNGATEKYSNVAVASTQGAVSVGSAGNERQITNVAGGTQDTDAVNLRQLDAAMAQTNQYFSDQFYHLRSAIDKVDKDANAGAAASMAMASMPQSVLPGKAMMTAGLANYQGQSAVAIGVSNFSENGRWVVNFNGSANTRGKVGAGIGVGMHW